MRGERRQSQIGEVGSGAAPAPPLTRVDLEALAERLVAAALDHATDGGAQIRVPGPVGRNGADVDGLEGFARTFLIAGFLLAGRNGHDPSDLAGRYARGIATGTDPGAPDRWPRLDEHPQAKVEAASLALILDLTRPWIWDRLDAGVRERVVAWLAPAVGDDTYPQINWVWFRLVVQTFLRSVDGPWSADEMRADLATHDRLARPGGWFADGDERAFDHYTGWAFHLYAVLWARMAGAADLAAERGTLDRDRLDRFLGDALLLVGGDGSPLVQGRSLVYRFAAAAPFWAGGIAAVPSHHPGLLRRAATSIVAHFLGNGVPNGGGTLDPGWHGSWPRLAQAYSGPGSPYWAAKGLLGLAVPPGHPLWSADEVALPVERHDRVALSGAPGWVLSATAADGIVRTINHGTDHARPGDLVGDSPLYARLGYSSATSPLLDDDAWASPLDQSVGLVDSDGRATHRAGMTPGPLRLDPGPRGPVAVAWSRSVAHWLEPAARQQHHGSGWVGIPTVAGEIVTVSVVRGPWEVRCVRLLGLTGPGGERAAGLRIGGWAVPDGDRPTGAGSAEVRGARLVSTVRCDEPDAVAAVVAVADASPLAPVAAVPTVTVPQRVGRWVVAVVGLAGREAVVPPPTTSISGDELVVDWPDGRSTIPLAAALSGPVGQCPGHTPVPPEPGSTSKEAQ